MLLEDREETGGEGMRMGLIHKPLYVCITFSTNKKKKRAKNNLSQRAKKMKGRCLHASSAFLH